MGRGELKRASDREKEGEKLAAGTGGGRDQETAVELLRMVNSQSIQ
jgi:hypothetical protein